MDAATRRRILLGLAANWFSRLSFAAIQFVQVPVFLHYWQESTFGEWLILSSIPTYLAFSTSGFGAVAGAEMTMAEARGDRDAALRSFQSCWWLILLIFAGLGGLAAALLALVPVARVLHLRGISEHDTKAIILYLGFSVLFAQVETLLQSAYRCVGRYSFGVLVKSGLTFFAVSSTLVPVVMHFGPRTAALVYAATSAGGTVLLALMVRLHIPWIRFGWHHASFAEIRRIAGPAFAFMGFPLGQALNQAGTLQAVGYALGPVAVVVFGTARTISRIALQIVQMVNFSYEPEFARAFAEKRTPESRDAMMRTLNRRACQTALAFALCVVAVMLLGGPALLTHWTHGKVPPSRPLLAILLAVVVLFALWSTSSTMLTATNRHQRLATVYVAATVGTVAVSWAVALRFARLGGNAGLYAVAASLLLAELAMNVYVLPATLKATQDTPGAFLRSLVEVPRGMGPAALLRRMRRRLGR